MLENMDLRDQIKKYFSSGFSNREILQLLKECHEINISNRSLERMLQRMNLYRRINKTDELGVANYIQQQLSTSGKLHGYRWMYHKCWMNGMIVSRETVRLILRHLDAEGVDLRARNRLRRQTYFSRGPNFVWHIDGYDKLKPYGIAINGCVDGFSRQLIWLHAYSTNSDPRVIAGYYMNAVSERQGCPHKIRIDMGTENIHVADMQHFLRLHGGDSQGADQSVISGPSTGNQRIEQWWLTLRKECIQFWLDLFDCLKGDGNFADSDLDKSLIQFCFLNSIQVRQQCGVGSLMLFFLVFGNPCLGLPIL
ncbi:hypothetical protein HHUSO_G610 [Huso huso]|uniref:Integrase core domain-containing protein n=1 Tax=Huso huso TaxID=61971 RepID=A0ABR1AAM7_HUSHU